MKFLASATVVLAICLLTARAGEIKLTDSQGLTAWLYTPTDQPDPNKTYWLVVGVHGAGGNGQNACGVAHFTKEFDDVIVLGPSFAQPKRDPVAPRPTGMPKEAYQMSGPLHEAKLKELVAEVGKTWRLHPKIIVHGFSAGAQFVHRFTFKNPDLVAGVSAHSGGGWATLEGDDKINPAAKAIPFAVSCGENDNGKSGPGSRLSRLEGCREFAASLKSLGFDVDLKTWPGVGHTLTADTCADAKKLVEKVRLTKSAGVSTPSNP
jgi:poly(3-hydroxybutyrate) depolymerase